MQTEAEIKQLKVARVKCQQDLLFCTRYFYKKLHKRKFRVLGHHQRIAEALERVLSGKCKRLLISIPPRYGKTELAVKHFIAHGLAISGGTANFIHLTASDALSLDNSEGTKDIVKSPEYQQMFPEVRIKQSTDSKKKWYTTAGGGVYATSAAGQVTGFGAGKVETEEEEHLRQLMEEAEFEEWLDLQLSLIQQKEGFGGAMIIDDSIKPDDADADIKRERVNRRWSSTIKSRLNSRNTPVIVIMQRLHPMDLIGYLQKIEPGEWEELSMKALDVDEQGKLVALDPSKHTVDDLVKMQDNEDEEVRIAFQRQYQQNPKPREGLMFPEDVLNYYDPATVHLDEMSDFRFGYCDPADEGGDSLSFPGARLITNKIYINKVIHNTKGTDINGPRCVEFILSERMNEVKIESNSAWALFRKSIKAAIEDSGSDCEITSVKNTVNKHTRILEASAFIRNHFVFRKDWRICGDKEYIAFMENLTTYREVQDGTSKNKHDDAPDACAGVAKYYRGQFPHLWQVKFNQ